jgi:hypothetical protein
VRPLSTNTLTQENTLELARLDLKHRTRGLDTYERHRRSMMLSRDPARDLSLGAKAATSPGFMRLAVKAAKTSDNAALALAEDVPLATVGPDETKTLLRAGSATSVGAFQSLDESRAYAPTRPPLELLDLVRLGTTDEAAVPYMRQTTDTPAAVEVAEAASTTTGTNPEALLPFEQVVSPVESIASWVPVTTRALSDVDELRGIVDEQLLYDRPAPPRGPGARGQRHEPEPARPRQHDRRSDTGEGGRLTASVASGTGYVGAWSQMVVWLRSTDVFVSRTHSDYLARNLAAVLSELRAASGCSR